MALSAATLARDDLSKFLAITITAKLRSDYSAVTLYVTDGDAVIDDSGNVHDSRMLAEAPIQRSTGSEAAPTSPAGTGIGNGVSPNVFRFRLDNSPDGQGNTLDAWRDYILVGAIVDVSLGAPMDETGARVASSAWEDQGRFYITRDHELGDNEFRFRCVSIEGWQPEEPLRRKVYLGLGPHGVAFPGDATKGAVGSGSTVGMATGYTLGFWMAFDALPSSTGVIADLLTVGDGSSDGFQLRILTGDALRLRYFDGTGASARILMTAKLSGWGTDPATLAGEPFSLVVRIAAESGGEQVVNVYVKGELVATLDPPFDTTRLTEPSPAAIECGYGLDGTLFETWIFDSDIGDDLAKEYSAGPLLLASSATLSHLYAYNDRTTASTTVEDLVLGGSPLTLDSGVAFVDSREGPNPNFPDAAISGHPVPFFLGKVANFPPVEINPWENIWEASRGAFDLLGATIGAQPIQIEYDNTGVTPLYKSVEIRDLNQGTGQSADNTTLAAIVLQGIADIAIAENRIIERPGSRVEVSGHPTAANDGVYTVVDVRGDTVLVYPDIDTEDLVSSCTTEVPAAADVAGWDPTSADGTLVAPGPIAGQILFDVSNDAGEAAPFPTLQDIYNFLIWAKGRDLATSGNIDLEDYDWVDVVSTTEVGAATLLAEPIALAIPSNEDPSFQKELGEALDSVFAWSSNSPTVGGLPGVRIGHYHVPVAGGTAYTEDQVVLGTWRNLGSRPPAWRLTVLYQPRARKLPQVTGVVTPSEEEAATAEYLEIEIYRNETIRGNFADAIDLRWKTSIHDRDGAQRLGQLVIRPFVETERRWYGCRVDILPGDLMVGEDINLTHTKLPSGASDLMILAVTGIATRRGADIIALG